MPLCPWLDAITLLSRGGHCRHLSLYLGPKQIHYKNFPIKAHLIVNLLTPKGSSGGGPSMIDKGYPEIPVSWASCLALPLTMAEAPAAVP